MSSTDECIKKQWYIYTMEYYLAIKRHTFESVLMRSMSLEPIVQSKVIRTYIYIYGIYKDGTEEPIYKAAVETQT